MGSWGLPWTEPDTPCVEPLVLRERPARFLASCVLLPSSHPDSSFVFLPDLRRKDGCFECSQAQRNHSPGCSLQQQRSCLLEEHLGRGVSHGCCTLELGWEPLCRGPYGGSQPSWTSAAEHELLVQPGRNAWQSAQRGTGSTKSRLVSNSGRSSCLSSPSAGSTGPCHCWRQSKLLCAAPVSTALGEQRQNLERYKGR